uniref:Uncharacterized protein n=1 Tax=Oryza sativa subsp. japonica TaxID=39947 RepID=Q6H4P6_ORYSJ|nr:hypothetical protein [Oryza sativa Japonica Group]
MLRRSPFLSHHHHPHHPAASIETSSAAERRRLWAAAEGRARAAAAHGSGRTRGMATEDEGNGRGQEKQAASVTLKPRGPTARRNYSRRGMRERVPPRRSPHAVTPYAAVHREEKRHDPVAAALARLPSRRRRLPTSSHCHKPPLPSPTRPPSRQPPSLSRRSHRRRLLSSSHCHEPVTASKTWSAAASSPYPAACASRRRRCGLLHLRRGGAQPARRRRSQVVAPSPLAVVSTARRCLRPPR